MRTTAMTNAADARVPQAQSEIVAGGSSAFKVPGRLRVLRPHPARSNCEFPNKAHVTIHRIALSPEFGFVPSRSGQCLGVPTAARNSRPSRTRGAPASSSAVALLVEDHREVEALFTKFEGLGERAHKSRETVVAKMIAALSMHASIEETVFYPEVRARVTGVDDDVLEALEEHHIVK